LSRDEREAEESGEDGAEVSWRLREKAACYITMGTVHARRL
jgi:hypothetical protein